MDTTFHKGFRPAELATTAFVYWQCFAAVVLEFFSRLPHQQQGTIIFWSIGVLVFKVLKIFRFVVPGRDIHDAFSCYIDRMHGGGQGLLLALSF